MHKYVQVSDLSIFFCRVKELRGESDPRLQLQQQEISDEDEDTVMTEKEEQDKVEEEEEEEEEGEERRRITHGHIRDFIRFHRVLVECDQTFAQESQDLLDDLSWQLHQKRPNDPSLLENYKACTQGLEDLMNRKNFNIQKLRDRMEMELE